MKRAYPTRRVVAPLVLAVFVAAYAVDAPAFRDSLLTTQFVPALLKFMRGAAAIVLAILAVTALFGRWYCSVLCPAGTVQELFFRIGRKLGLARNAYARRRNYAGWLLLTLAALLLFVGFTDGYTLFDPLGWFGRVVTPITGTIRDFALGTQNAGFQWGRAGLLFALVAAMLVIFPLFKGRRLCQTVCPVGALLGVVSSLAPRRMAIDESACVSCGKCERACPMDCADSKGKRIDSDRCVLCLACAPACPTGAIAYRTAAGKAKAEPALSRRELLAGGVSWLGAAAFVFARWRPGESFGEIAVDGKVIPPGGGTKSKYYRSCIGCQSCVAACPVGIVRPDAGGFQPALDYDRGYCQYGCADCANACPTGALVSLPLAEKQVTRIADTKLVLDRCVVVTEGTSCGACAEVCPTHAVTMEDPGDGTPTRPAFYRDHCIGCGACYHVCPASPRAFVVAGLSRHEKALPMRETGEGFHPPPAGNDLTDFPF